MPWGGLVHTKRKSAQVLGLLKGLPTFIKILATRGHNGLSPLKLKPFLQISPLRAWGKVPDTLKLVARFRFAGLPITCSPS